MVDWIICQDDICLDSARIRKAESEERKCSEQSELNLSCNNGSHGSSGFTGIWIIDYVGSFGRASNVGSSGSS